MNSVLQMLVNCAKAAVVPALAMGLASPAFAQSCASCRQTVPRTSAQIVTPRPSNGWARIAYDLDGSGRFSTYEDLYVGDLQAAVLNSRQRRADQLSYVVQHNQERGLAYLAQPRPLPRWPVETAALPPPIQVETLTTPALATVVPSSTTLTTPNVTTVALTPQPLTPAQQYVTVVPQSLVTLSRSATVYRPPATIASPCAIAGGACAPVASRWATKDTQWATVASPCATAGRPCAAPVRPCVTVAAAPPCRTTAQPRAVITGSPCGPTGGPCAATGSLSAAPGKPCRPEVPHRETVTPEGETMVPQNQTPTPPCGTATPEHEGMVPESETPAPPEGSLPPESETIVPEGTTVVPEGTTVIPAPQSATIAPHAVAPTPPTVAVSQTPPTTVTAGPETSTVVPVSAAVIPKSVMLPPAGPTKAEELTGNVIEVRLLDLNGAADPHRFARIQTVAGNRIVEVDLGPAQRSGWLALRANQLIRVSGRPALLDNRPALVATYIRMANGRGGDIVQSPTAERSSEGLLTASWTADRDGVTHRIARMRMTNDRMMLVDLGPEENLQNLHFMPGQRLFVRGYPGELYSLPALVVQRFQLQGQVVEVPSAVTPVCYACR